MYLISSGSWDDYNLTVQKMAVKIKGDADFFEKARYFSYLKKWTRVKVNERLIYWYWYAEAGSYGCYGYGRNTTPNIDAIAREGVRFDNYYCSDAPCLPSRAALLESKTEWLAMEERRQTVSGRELQEILKITVMSGNLQWRALWNGIYEESEIMLHE